MFILLLPFRIVRILFWSLVILIVNPLWNTWLTIMYLVINVLRAVVGARFIGPKEFSGQIDFSLFPRDKDKYLKFIDENADWI
jgi:hypothetical protein